jgi:hypothetical protein
LTLAHEAKKNSLSRFIEKQSRGERITYQVVKNRKIALSTLWLSHICFAAYSCA